VCVVCARASVCGCVCDACPWYQSDDVCMMCMCIMCVGCVYDGTEDDDEHQ